METDATTLNKDILRNFVPLQTLSDTQLELLVGSIEMEQAPAGRMLIKRGSKDNYSFFLVTGHIRLRAEDGRVNDVTAKDPAASSPISQLMPRRYDVLSVTPVRFIRINEALMNQISANHGSRRVATAGYLVDGDEEEDTSEFENQISYKFLQDLEQDQLVLPSLPEIAVRIGKAFQDDVTDAAMIAEMIQTDPVITAKLIKAANSAMYGRRTPVETCVGAVIRLGAGITHKLVMSFAMRELFQSDSGLLQQRMQELWRHSTKVGALCYVLAKHDSRFDPEHAMLIGLLHDIGVVAVLNYACSFPMEARQPQIIDQAVKRLRAQTGSMILRKWGFPMEFVVAALEAEDWMRDKGLTPDYCDLVVIAQLHSFVGTDHAFSAPAINEVPAHARLALGELTPKMSLRILDEAKDQTDHAESLLNI